MRTTRAAGLLLALLLAASTVAACSSGGSDDGATGGTTTSGGKDGGTTTTTEAKGSGGSGSTKATGTKLEYAAAIGTNLEKVGLSLKADTAACLGGSWVRIIGVERFAKEGIAPKDITKPAFQYAQLHLTHKEALEMIDAFSPCGAEPLDVVLAGIGGSFDDAQRACVAENLGTELTRELLARGLQGIDLTSEQQRELYALDPLCKLGPAGQDTTSTTGG